ncbi:hypothetical protein ACLVNF_00860 [Streptococcus pneumoniae]|nr:hypothetical protein [Streptococcus pneumoniae]MDG9496685.1 hypothetical protein [Streptococcus pneumoniae]HEU6283288.1 hypothetical protein [Streptococcus pneumoniae]
MEKYVHISSENKKARLTVLVSCLLNSSNLSPFVGLFLLPFLRTLGEQVVKSNISIFCSKARDIRVRKP